MSHVLLRPAEEGLRSACERHAWRLVTIAKDSAVLAAEPFRRHENGVAVDFRVVGQFQDAGRDDTLDPPRARDL